MVIACGAECMVTWLKIVGRKEQAQRRCWDNRWVVMNTLEYDSTLAGLVENAVKQVKEIDATKSQLTVRIDQLKQAVIFDTASLDNITRANVDDEKYTTDLQTQCESEASEYDKGQNSITGEIAVT